MSEPLSQAFVESEIQRLAALAEQVTQTIRQRADAAANAEADYRRDHAHAFLEADGAMDMRKARADLEATESFRDRKLAEAALEAAKEAGRNYRAELDSWRSINANLRPLVTS